MTQRTAPEPQLTGRFTTFCTFCVLISTCRRRNKVTEKLPFIKYVTLKYKLFTKVNSCILHALKGVLWNGDKAPHNSALDWARLWRMVNFTLQMQRTVRKSLWCLLGRRLSAFDSRESHHLPLPLQATVFSHFGYDLQIKASKFSGTRVFNIPRMKLHV